MARNNPGYDIESLRADGTLLFIEVKGRVAGAETVTVTRNKILTGLNKTDDHVLAIVEMGEDNATRARYVRRAFSGTEDLYFGVASVNFQWRDLWQRGSDPS